MISIIYGAKGSGKTKRIIDAANERARLSKGSVVYITDCADHSSVVDNGIRFIDINHYDVTDENGMLCFIKGLLAGNYDITDVYIDGLAKFVKKDVSELEGAFRQLDLLGTEFNVTFTLTVSAEEVPDFMRRYICLQARVADCSRLGKRI